MDIGLRVRIAISRDRCLVLGLCRGECDIATIEVRG
jgi:hypothetical protein